MNQERYYVFGHKEIIRENIAWLDIQATNAAAKTKSLFLRQNRGYIRSYWLFHELFNNLMASSRNFLKASDGELDLIDELVDDPEPGEPLKLISAFWKYKKHMKRSGLTEIGYHDRSFTQKMRART